MLSMNRPLLTLAALLALGYRADAQNAPVEPQQIAPQHITPRQIIAPTETMVVLGSATPVPLAESPRPVTVLPIESLELFAGTPFDILRQDSSVFLEQRGDGGTQADIVLQGGSFEQTLVLLNGFRIDDAQTAHHDLDLPVPMEAMNSIQILEGAGSTLHGVDALSGVVDFLTAAPDHNSLRMRLGEGSYQANEESLLGSAVRSAWSGRVTADRNFSTGFMYDRDYRDEDASAESWSASRLGVSDVLVAGSDRSFGANQFYGDYSSWERTKSWFASVRQELGSQTTAAFAYRRHTDEFVLLRDNPEAYENNHTDGSWQANLRHTISVDNDSVLLMGLEADGDSLRSFNFSEGVTSYALGVHARNRGAGYVDLDLHPASKRWTLSAGAREEIFSGGAQAIFSPQLSGSLRLSSQLKLRASGGYGFRIPTYTDLYYSDPTTLGNPNLKPESAWSGNAGADWTPSRSVSLTVTGFYSQQHDTIDYVRADTLPNPYLPPSCTAPNTWCATNLNGLHFAGAESTFTWLPSASQALRISWTGVHGARNTLHGLQSEYVFNYPVQNIYAAWTSQLGHSIALSNMVQLTQRYQQTVYPVWNIALTRDTGRLRPYIRADNLSNTGYQEIVGVNMPSRQITGGFVIQLGR
jgi:outer membrane cobalamin receptor